MPPSVCLQQTEKHEMVRSKRSPLPLVLRGDSGEEVQGVDFAGAAAPAPRPSAASANWKQCDDGAKAAAPAPRPSGASKQNPKQCDDYASDGLPKVMHPRKGPTFLAIRIWLMVANEEGVMIRSVDIQAVLDATKNAVVADLKKSGHAAIPRLVSFKAVGQPAKDAHQKMSFGKRVQVDAKPAKKVVKAIVNRKSRKSLFD